MAETKYVKNPANGAVYVYHDALGELGFPECDKDGKLLGGVVTNEAPAAEAVDFKEMTKAQLEEYAKQTFGVELKATKKADMVAEIEALAAEEL